MMGTAVHSSIVSSRNAILGQSIIFIHTEDQYGFKSNQVNGIQILCLLLHVKQSEAKQITVLFTVCGQNVDLC
jgi:RAB protein geranylgeranyltransferase component A